LKRHLLDVAAATASTMRLVAAVNYSLTRHRADFVKKTR